MGGIHWPILYNLHINISTNRKVPTYAQFFIYSTLMQFIFATSSSWTYNTGFCRFIIYGPGNRRIHGFPWITFRLKRHQLVFCFGQDVGEKGMVLWFSVRAIRTVQQEWHDLNDTLPCHELQAGFTRVSSKNSASLKIKFYV